MPCRHITLTDVQAIEHQSGVVEIIEPAKFGLGLPGLLAAVLDIRQGSRLDSSAIAVGLRSHNHCEPYPRFVPDC